MNNADMLYRLSGMLTLASGAYNVLLSGLLFFTLVWVCVGVLWLVPLTLALIQMCGGLVMLIVGRQLKALAFIPALGVLTSLMNLNFLGMLVDVSACVVGIVGFTQVQQLEQREH